MVCGVRDAKSLQGSTHRQDSRWARTLVAPFRVRGRTPRINPAASTKSEKAARWAAFLFDTEAYKPAKLYANDINMPPKT